MSVVGFPSLDLADTVTGLIRGGGGGGGGANYAAYEVRVNGQCVKNVPYSDLSIARVKFCEIRSALPLAVKFVLVRRCI